MSSLEDRKKEMEAGQTDERTMMALASIEAEARKATAMSYAVIGGAMSYGDASLGNGLFGKMSRAAMWFCIWFAMIVPVFLFWKVAL